jgi:hypothetical protein
LDVLGARVGKDTSGPGAGRRRTRASGSIRRRPATTGLIAYVAAVLAVVVTAFVGDDGDTTADPSGC